jgi:opacity protein-like surface antigen
MVIAMTIKKQALIFCLVGGSLGYTSHADAATRMHVLGAVHLGGASLTQNNTWKVESPSIPLTHNAVTKLGKTGLSYGLDLGFGFEFGKVTLDLAGQMFWSKMHITNASESEVQGVSTDRHMLFKSNRASWAAVIRAAYALHKHVRPFIGFGYVWRPSQVSLSYNDSEIFQGKKTFGGYSPRIGMLASLTQNLHARLEGGVNFFKSHSFPSTNALYTSETRWTVKPREMFLALAFCYKLGMKI